ncbi:MAG TPA: transglycosylase SLT domain-containing protein [Bryobacteraceae bacterium]|nr:transglycosylase SLT domain-containing protein [Bryobacteraceae bacterium]
MSLAEFHRIFPDSIQWRVTPLGVEIENQGLVVVSSAVQKRAALYLQNYGAAYAAASAEFKVPIELLIACSLTEAAVVDPENCCRQEPGYISDEKSPDRVSAGFCQLLISTARDVMKDPKIDRKWLCSVSNSLRACAAYIKKQSGKTNFDPVCVACAYNSGGLYKNDNPKNRWRLRQYPIGTSHHADRFVENFNAALGVATGKAMDGIECVRYSSLLAN